MIANRWFAKWHQFHIEIIPQFVVHLLQIGHKVAAVRAEGLVEHGYVQLEIDDR